MNGFVVVDASLVVKWIIDEEDSDLARAIVRSWHNAGTTPVAPYLMPAEVANALHRRVVRDEMSIESASRRMDALYSFEVGLRQTPGLHVRAIELANQLGQGAAYDSHYLALAQTLDCDLWTADASFVRAARPLVANVRWMGEAAPRGR